MRTSHQVPARSRRKLRPSVTFDLEHVHSEDTGTRADLLAPGHPLHDAVMDEAIRHFGTVTLKQRHGARIGNARRAPRLLVGVDRGGYRRVTGAAVVRDASATPTSTSLGHGARPLGRRRTWIVSPHRITQRGPYPRRAAAVARSEAEDRATELDHHRPNFLSFLAEVQAATLG